MTSRYVWIIAGGLLQVPAIKAARSLGLSTIVTDGNPACVCAPLADVFINLDTYDVAGHVDAACWLAKDYNIAGVFTEGADVEVTVAAVAEALGLPGISPAVATRCHDKAAMRRAFFPAYVSPIKWATATWLTAHGKAEIIGYPLVVKAIDNCASRGVRRVNDERALSDAVEYALGNSRAGYVLLEECLIGNQQSVEILFDDAGACHYLNIVDRPFAEDGVTELGHINPSDASPAQSLALFQITEAAARACGVRWGVFKADTIWTTAGPRVLEVTARLSGGFDCQYTTPAATGRDFIRAAMAQACGMPIDPADLEHKRHRYAAAWAAFPKPGRVTRILPPLSTDPQEFIRVKVGDVIKAEHNADRAGFVIVARDTHGQALTAAAKAAGRLADRIITE